MDKHLYFFLTIPNHEDLLRLLYSIYSSLVNRSIDVRSAQLLHDRWFLFCFHENFVPQFPAFTLTQEVNKLEGNFFNLRAIRCSSPPWAVNLYRCYLWGNGVCRGMKLFRTRARLLSVEVLNLREQTDVNMYSVQRKEKINKHCVVSWINLVTDDYITLSNLV